MLRGAGAHLGLVVELRPVDETSTMGRRGALNSSRTTLAPPDPPLFLPTSTASLTGSGAGLKTGPCSTPTSTTRPRRHRKEGTSRRTTRPRRIQARSRAR